MEIGEILELTQTKKISDIAKESLSIGEKPTRDALKLAGCFNVSGKRGWFFEGDRNVLEQSIYDFSPPIKRRISAKKEIAATTDKAEALVNPTSQLPDKTESKQVNKPKIKETNNPINQQVDEKISKQVETPTSQLPNKSTSKQTTKSTMKKVTYEIEERFHDELKVKAIKEKRTVSEIVNEIIRNGVQ